jgi:hypothetical protein
MNTRVEQLLDRLHALQGELETAFEERSAELRYRVERRRVVFEAGVRAQHRAARIKLSAFLARTRLLVVLTSPLIYAMIVPLVLLDIFVTLYQVICFPVYGIARVRRSDHIVVDRQHLAYLNALQKLNCVYCGYGNGMLSYAHEVAGRTEKYWCPIKHSRRVAGTHRHYPTFADYGDAAGFQTLSSAPHDVPQPGAKPDVSG